MIKKEHLLNDKSIKIADLFVKTVPCEFLQPFFNKAFDEVLKKYGQDFELLSDFDEPVFLIKPKDFSLVFKLKPYGMESYLKVFKTQEDAGEVDAIISGNSLKLIDLLEGKTDGDALFFSRELDISGDMEKVVAFRNAIENAQIDVYEDVVSFFEPAKQTAMGAFVGLASKIDKHIYGLRSYILSPAMDKIDELNSKLDEMKNEKNS